MNKLISIVIPVYNVEQYLPQCLDSVINQSYKNLEIICVNDGSMDGSLDILNQYAENDNRINIISQDNQGVSFARNEGLRNVHGDYIMFLDSDDWIELDTCERALSEAVENEADIVMWPYLRERGGSSKKKIIFDRRISFESPSDVNHLHCSIFGPIGEGLIRPENMDSLCTAYGKLYRADTIQKSGVFFHRLEDIGTCEDGLFNAELFCYVEKVVYINEWLYHYRRGSGYTSKYKPQLKDQWKTLFSLMDSIIIRYGLGKNFSEALENRKAVSVLQLSLSAAGDHEASSIEKIHLIGIILNDAVYRDAVKQLRIDLMPIHWKVFFVCCKCRFPLAVFLLCRCMIFLISK